METVKLSQANQALIQNRSMVQKEQPKVSEQKKNGKKLLAFGALAVSAIAIAGLIIKGKHDKAQKATSEVVGNLQNPTKEISFNIQEEIQRRLDRQASIERAIKVQDELFEVMTTPQKSAQESAQAILDIEHKQEISQEAQRRLEQENAIKRAQIVQDELFEVMTTPQKSAQESAQAILDIKQQEIDEEIERRLEQKEAIWLARELQDRKFEKMAKPEKSAKESFMDILKIKGFKLEEISFSRGIAKIPDGTNFSGEVSKKLPNGDLIKLKYQDGLICESSREGSVNFKKTYLRDKNTLEICKKNENSEAVTKLIFYQNNNKLDTIIFPDGTKKELRSDGSPLDGIFKIAGVEKKFVFGKLVYESFPDGTKKGYFRNGKLKFENLPSGYKKGYKRYYNKFNTEPQLVSEIFPDGTSRKWAHKREALEKFGIRPTKKGYDISDLDDTAAAWFANDCLYYESFADGTEKIWSKDYGEPLKMNFFDGSGFARYRGLKIPNIENCVEYGRGNHYGDNAYWAKYSDGSRKEFSIWGQTVYEKLADGTERFYRDEFKDGCTNLFREILPDGTERYWAVNDQLTFEKLPDGSKKAWYTNGQLKFEKLPDGSEKTYDRINCFIDKNVSQKIQAELNELEEEIENIRRTISTTEGKQPEIAKELQVKLAQLEKILTARKEQFALFKAAATPQKSAEESANFFRFTKTNNMIDPFKVSRKNISYDDSDSLPFARDMKKEPGHIVYIQNSVAPNRKEKIIVNSTEDWWFNNYQKLFGYFPHCSQLEEKTGDIPFKYFFDILKKEDPNVHDKISHWHAKPKTFEPLEPKRSNYEHTSSEIEEAIHHVSASSPSVYV